MLAFDYGGRRSAEVLCFHFHGVQPVQYRLHLPGLKEAENLTQTQGQLMVSFLQSYVQCRDGPSTPGSGSNRCSLERYVKSEKQEILKEDGEHQGEEAAFR
jgi:hypothetical protein